MSFLRRALVSMEAAVLSSKQSLGMKLNVPTEKEIFLFDSRAALSEWVASSDRYRLNAQMDGWNPLNLYMGFIRTPPNEWVDVELPFRDFLLTTKGYYKYDDPTPLDPGKLRSIGIAIADQKEGDFEIRVQWIKAIAKVESREVSDEEIEARYQQQHLRTRKNLKKPDGISI
ncbi:hypothetical protein P43SY_005113 [Pythium insidiosum]|uniref:NADH:ubiquinone oxidoreductase intermediate-associated protein 30 domain-containing protein n=1 Tax=Pythium insidiosum TaxID=114742 RepID=A0AAD5LG15_PYTIN|nr:hypothetical protein P43SY_005113 [Pythium insidiosum]